MYCMYTRAAETTKLVSIGDKGRSQLMRTNGEMFTHTFSETYKVRVTFAQVRRPWRQAAAAAGTVAATGTAAAGSRESGGKSAGARRGGEGWDAGCPDAWRGDWRCCTHMAMNTGQWTRGHCRATELRCHGKSLHQASTPHRGMRARPGSLTQSDTAQESALRVHTCVFPVPVIVNISEQASLIAEDLLKSNPEAVKILFNKFRSAISFKPTLATILTPEVRIGIGIGMSFGFGLGCHLWGHGLAWEWELELVTGRQAGAGMCCQWNGGELGC